MKIDYVILSSDLNPIYLDFWNPVKRLWSEHIGIKPVLIKICDENSFTDNGDSIIISIKAIDGINTGFQSQIARIFAYNYFENKNCLISDIDMFPLSKNYFIDSVKDIDDTKIVIYSSDAYPLERRFPMCYVLGNSDVMKSVLDIDGDYEFFCRRLKLLNQEWNTDEIYLTSKLRYLPNIVKLKRGWHNGVASRRIDRVNWQYKDYLLTNGFYIDSHSIRPYSENKEIIDKLINQLI